MPSFKINNWDLDVNKKKLSVSIKAHNSSNTLYFGKKFTNKDIASGGFKLIDDIDDLYASLTEGSNPCQQNVKLNFTDDGHLTISQKLVQADREKVFNNDIALEKREPKVLTYVSQKEHKALQDRVTELENELKGLKTGYGNDLAEIKKMLDSQANSIKSLQEENVDLKKTLEDAEKNKPQGSNLTFISHPNFNLSNNGKTAVSNTNLNHAIFLSPSVSKGVTYSFKIVGDNFIMLGLIPENDPKTDYPYSQANVVGVGCQGGIWPGGTNTCNVTFKGGDILSIQLTTEAKAIFTVNNQATYTCQLPCSISNYQIFMYTNFTVGIGVEAL